MVDITIDGQQVQAKEHMTILGAAKMAGIPIPTLCYLKGVNDIGACRVCLVEVEGTEQLVASCNNEVTEGMVIHTNSPKVRSARKTNVELLLSQHDTACTSCVRSGNCQLQSVANDLNITSVPYAQDLVDVSWPQDFALIRDAAKCIKCLSCIQVCDEVQGVGVWDLTSRASRTNVGVAGGIGIEESACALCGQCITHCPTGARG